MRTVNFLNATSPARSLYFINKIKYHLMSSVKRVFPMPSDSSAGIQKQIHVQRVKRRDFIPLLV